MTDNSFEEMLNDPHYKRFALLMNAMREHNVEINEKLDRLELQIEDIKQDADNTFRLVLFGAAMWAILAIKSWFL